MDREGCRNRSQHTRRCHQQTVMPPAWRRSAFVDLRAADGRRRRNRARRRRHRPAPPRLTRRRNRARAQPAQPLTLARVFLPEAGSEMLSSTFRDSLLFLILGAGVTPAQGGVEPTAGSTLNQVYSASALARLAVPVHAASFFVGILQSPSNCAPSFSTRLGVLMLHCTRAVAISSTRSRAVTSPLKAPAIVTLLALIRALTTAPVAITTSSPVISPSASPSIFTGPRKVSLPEALVPLPIRDSNSSAI